MDEELQLGLCVIKVLCLIVIAMGVHKLANPGYGYSYMSGRVPRGVSDNKLGAFYQGGNTIGKTVLSDNVAGGMRNSSHFIGDGQHSSPKFWNIGSVEQSRGVLSAAQSQYINPNPTLASGEVALASAQRNAVVTRLNSGNYGSEAARLADEQLASNLGAMRGSDGVWRGDVSSFRGGKGRQSNFNGKKSARKTVSRRNTYTGSTDTNRFENLNPY